MDMVNLHRCDLIKQENNNNNNKINNNNDDDITDINDFLLDFIFGRV